MAIGCAKKLVERQNLCNTLDLSAFIAGNWTSNTVVENLVRHSSLPHLDAYQSKYPESFSLIHVHVTAFYSEKFGAQSMLCPAEKLAAVPALTLTPI